MSATTIFSLIANQQASQRQLVAALKAQPNALKPKPNSVQTAIGLSTDFDSRRTDVRISNLGMVRQALEASRNQLSQVINGDLTELSAALELLENSFVDDQKLEDVKNLIAGYLGTAAEKSQISQSLQDVGPLRSAFFSLQTTGFKASNLAANTSPTAALPATPTFEALEADPATVGASFSGVASDLAKAKVSVQAVYTAGTPGATYKIKVTIGDKIYTANAAAARDGGTAVLSNSTPGANPADTITLTYAATVPTDFTTDITREPLAHQAANTLKAEIEKALNAAAHPVTNLAPEIKIGSAFPSELAQSETPVVEVRGVYTAAVVGPPAVAAKTEYTISVTLGDNVYTAPAAAAQNNGVILLVNEKASGSGDTISFKYPATVPTALTTDVANQTDANTAAKSIAADLQSLLGQTTFASSTPLSEETLGIADFRFNAGSAYGEGSFKLSYDGRDVIFQNQDGKVLESCPLSLDALQEAGQVAQKSGSPAAIRLAIGTLYVDANAATATLPEEPLVFEFQTSAQDFTASISISNTSQQNISLLNIADPKNLWGTEEILDAAKLEDPDYRVEVRGWVNHGREQLQTTFKQLSNLLTFLEQNINNQNTTSEALKSIWSEALQQSPIQSSAEVSDFSGKTRSFTDGILQVIKFNQELREAARQISASAF